MNRLFFSPIICQGILHLYLRGHRGEWWRYSSNLENECHEEDPIMAHEGIVVEKSMPMLEATVIAAGISISTLALVLPLLLWMEVF